MKLGENIKWLRKNRQLTQSDIAAALGSTKQTVGLWENGITTPHAETLPKIADLLGVTIDELFNYEKKVVLPPPPAILKFIEECCELSEANIAKRADLYNAYCEWGKGKVVTANHFARMLRAFVPNIGDTRLCVGYVRARYYTGIGLKQCAAAEIPLL